MSNTIATGSVTVTPFRNGWRARTRYKSPTGAKDVQVLGRTQAEARQRLMGRLEELTPRDSLRSLAEDWLRALPALGLSAASQRVYRTMCEVHVIGREESLTSVEYVTPGMISDLLHDVGVQHGCGAAKTTKSVLSNIFKWGARYDRVTSNPVKAAFFSPRAIQDARGEQRSKARAFTREEIERIMRLLREDKAAVRQGLYLPCLLMKSLGVRVGEALSVRRSHVDLEGRTILIEGTKTAGSRRVLSIPPDLLEELLLAPSGPADGLLCPTRTGARRDISNTCRALRRFFDRYGFQWASSHTFRKTLATRMDEAGFTAREIADQLGHSKISMTQDVYLGRNDGPARMRDLTF